LSGNKIIGKLLMGEYLDAWREERNKFLKYWAHLPGFGQYPCPLCGSRNEFHVDLIEIIEKSYDSLSMISRDKLLSIEIKLKSSIDKNLSYDEFERSKNEIFESTPELSSVKSLLPKTRNEAYAFLALILTLVTIIISSLPENDKPEGIVERTVVNNYYNFSPLNPEEVEKIRKAPKLPTPPKKIGRNDKCHCNSGKKFKNCHGMDK
jgi:hypothetical protein